jgi:iduronate 2-sulfatase
MKPISLIFLSYIFLSFLFAPLIKGADQPNVLLIMVDDLRPALGCYGDRLAITPSIDRFAKSARVFRRAYCHQAVCGPSRASILTGRLPDNTRVWHNRNHFRTTHPDLITLPQLFKNNGYQSLGLGKVFSGDEREDDPPSWSAPAVLRQQGWKNYLLPENTGSGKQAPFEFADVEDDAYPDGKLAKLAIETLGQFSATKQPFFLAVGFFKPHLPFNAPRKYLDMHPADKFQDFTSLPRTIGAPAAAYPDHLELAGYEGVPNDEQVESQQALELRRAYYACVTYADAQVGRVLETLKQTGLDQNTIVVVMGDHGFSLGEANHWCKDTNFELDTHVPLIVRVPGMKQPGVATTALTQYADVYPTLAELAGLEPPPELDGSSLVPILDDPTTPGREFVLSQFSRPFKPTDPTVMGYSIRTDTNRYTRWITWPERQLLAEELYDYTTGPSTRREGALLIEEENLAAHVEQTVTRQTLSQKLDQMLSERITVKDNVGPAPEKKRKKNKEKAKAAGAEK